MNHNATGSAIGYASTQPPAPLQIDESVESLRIRSEMLAEVAAILVRRLEPVTGEVSDRVSGDNSPTPMKVPLAHSLDSVSDRIASVSKALEAVTRALQI